MWRKGDDLAKIDMLSEILVKTWKARRCACPASTVMKESSKYQIRVNAWYMWYIFVYKKKCFSFGIYFLFALAIVWNVNIKCLKAASQYRR